MALKRTGIPLTALELADFSKEETLRYVQGLAWAEQPLNVENIGSLERGSQNEEVSPFRDALVPFANWLYFQTRGQPLYLVETLRGLHTREIIVPSLQENGTWGLVLRIGLLAQIPVGELVPANVRELIRSQLGQLTSSAWALLVAGAALGKGLTFERLIKVAQLDEQEGLRALEELLRKRLLCEGTLTEESQAIDEYVFPREMNREVVYQEAGTTRQRLVQRRVSLVMREEEAILLPAAPVDGFISTYTMNEQGGRIDVETVGRVMHPAIAKDSSGTARRQSGAGAGMQAPLTVREWGTEGHIAQDLLRSPPGSPFQSFS